MKDKKRKLTPEPADFMSVGDKEGHLYTIVITSVDLDKNEGTYKWFKREKDAEAFIEPRGYLQ